MDDFSALVRQVLKVFGAIHPIRVGIGISSGFLAQLLSAVALAYVPNSPLFKTLNDFPTYYYSIIFVGLVMVPVGFGHKGAIEEISNQIRAIEALLTAANLSQAQRRLIWHSLVQKYLEALEPKFNSAPNTNLIEQAKKEIASGLTNNNQTD